MSACTVGELSGKKGNQKKTVFALDMFKDKRKYIRFQHCRSSNPNVDSKHGFLSSI